MFEREITDPVVLTTASGDLNPAALGWTRRPLHDTSGIPDRRRWGRNKRWEYWNAMTPTHIVAMTVSCIDYLSLNSLWVLDRATGVEIEKTTLSPGAGAATLPASLGDGPATARVAGLTIDVDEQEGGTRLRAQSDRVRVDILAERPAGHESLGVVVPWRRGRSIRHFQYTAKDVARPARGELSVDGVRHPVEEDAWAVLDHGRGRWPYRVHWNWAAGSGVAEGRRIGLQLGSKWTDGSGATENALVIDGRLSKISEELVWDYTPGDWMRPWRVHGDTADLTFAPFHHRHARTNALVITTRTDQLFGVWTGWVKDDSGAKVLVDGIEGWAEDVLNRW
ncbi:DUF2804 domain-containing protein [Microbacterium sp. NPDC055903]